MECLIVEDVPEQRLQYEEAIGKLGYVCHCVASVSEATYLLRTHDFDVILLDLYVEDGSTLQLADYLFITGSDATVILITGSGAYPRGEASVVSPRIDYVMHKPINLADLCALVAYCRNDRTAPEPLRT